MLARGILLQFFFALFEFFHGRWGEHRTLSGLHHRTAMRFIMDTLPIFEGSRQLCILCFYRIKATMDILFVRGW